MVRLFALCMVLFLTSCALGRKTAYRLADTYFLNAVDTYFDLDGDQKRRAEAAVDELFAWHKKQELPRVAALLRQAAADAADGISAQEVMSYAEKADESFQTILRKAAPPAAALLRSLSDAQIARMEKETQKHQKKEAEKLEPPDAKAISRSEERLRKSLERWIGDLTPEQERIVGRFAKESLPLRRAKEALNEIRNRSFSAFIRSRPEPAEYARGLEKRMTSPLESGGREWAEASDKLERAQREFLVAIFTSLNATQRQIFRDTLLAWAQDADELSKS